MHTPGPWKAVKITEKTMFNIETERECRDDAESNANLMAAAPDLLEVCERVLREIDSYDSSISVGAWEDLTAAVTKARTVIEAI